MRLYAVFCLLAALEWQSQLRDAGLGARAAPAQEVLSLESVGGSSSGSSSSSSGSSKDWIVARPRRSLRGRFLHITDMHPDPYYREGSSVSSACHRKAPKKEKERSGYYGTPGSECDSPFRLTNLTMDFLDKHWAKEIDFVVWTGDSARHDNDRELPRTPGEIYELNRAISRRMEEVFVRRGIPVVPCLGNNDVWPHNIMTPGPNSITNEFSNIWRSFIPFSSYQVFQRGGYFTVEVVAGEVAVISLNTMYFYDSNKAVEGCEYLDRDDPGNLQLDWLEVQLDRYRDRGMQVYLMGHVPPSAGNYFPGCFVRYAELALRFQDTILGHLYGHMNADHFYFIEKEDVDLPEETESDGGSKGKKKKKKNKKNKKDKKKNKKGKKGKKLLYESDELVVTSEGSLYKELLKDFKTLRKEWKKNKKDGNGRGEGEFEDDFVVVNVSPSVVPNPYLPSFRVFAYNVTGTKLTEGSRARASDVGEAGYKQDRMDPVAQIMNEDMSTMKDRKHHKPRKGKDGPEVDCGKKENQERWECRPEKPKHTDRWSPSRTNQLWTPLGYAQYWLPDVGSGNASVEPKFRLEYLTFALPSLHGINVNRTGSAWKMNSESGADAAGGEEEEGMAKDRETGWVPIPLGQLPKSIRKWNGTGSVPGKYVPYKLADLTVGSWLRLAARLGDKKRERLRQRFGRYMYMNMTGI